MQPLIKCISCGGVYSSPFNFGGRKSTGSFVNCQVQCPNPNCGTVNRVPDGEYDVEDDVLVAFRAASRADLDAFLAIVEALKAGTINEAQAVEQAEKVKSGFGSTLAKLIKMGKKPAAIAWLITTLLSGVGAGAAIYYGEAQKAASAQQHLDAMTQHADQIEANAIAREANKIAAAAQAVPPAQSHLGVLPGLPGGPPIKKIK